LLVIGRNASGEFAAQLLTARGRRLAAAEGMTRPGARLLAILLAPVT
jgi:hypothetical protein